jgi:hypothetical protein
MMIDTPVHTLALTIQMGVDPVAAQRLVCLDTVTLSIQMLGPAIALGFNPVRLGVMAVLAQLVGSRLRTLIDAIGMIVQALVNNIALMIQPLLDTVASGIEPVVR